MTRKKRSITLSIEEYEKAQLEQLALEFGQTWGDKPNVSKLIKAIARGQLRLAANHDWTRDRIDTLYSILGYLKDVGKIEEALVLSRLLWERGEISDPLRRELQDWMEHPSASWRVEIDRRIRQQRPFSLVCQDAAERLWSFTVRHAAIAYHEDRQYLDCWCDETEGNRDIEDLRHNWSLRLDRIPEEAVVADVEEGGWQPALDRVEAEFHLLRGLAFGYRSKTGDDLVNEWLPDRSRRRVVRRVDNTFWFFRELRRYGPDCVLIAPEEVRSRFAKQAKAMAALYRD